MIRALIVDDERLARVELRSMLRAHAEIEVVGEAQSVAEARSLLASEEPDVVFLDIQLQGESGFDLLDQSTPTFRTIFVTAHDSHALRAFDVNALDYLLKPIHPERLSRAISNLHASPSKAPTRQLEYEDRLLLDRFIKVRSIVMITAAGDYSEVLTEDNRKTETLKPLREWEERLPPRHFTRVHRSAIINLEFVDGLEDWFSRSYRVRLKNLSEPIVVSRRYAAQMKARFA